MTNFFSLERKIKYSFQKAKYDLEENFRMIISKYVSLLLKHWQDK